MNSIRRKSDFAFLLSSGVRKRTKMLTLILANKKDDKRNNNIPLTCVVASKKKVGNAVHRNFAKRRMKSLMRKYFCFLKAGDLLMVITSKDVCSAQYQALDSDYLFGLKKLITNRPSLA